MQMLLDFFTRAMNPGAAEGLFLAAILGVLLGGVYMVAHAIAAVTVNMQVARREKSYRERVIDSMLDQIAGKTKK